MPGRPAGDFGVGDSHPGGPGAPAPGPVRRVDGSVLHGVGIGSVTAGQQHGTTGVDGGSYESRREQLGLGRVVRAEHAE